MYEGEETPCPVCEDYVGGEQHGVEKPIDTNKDIPNKANGNGSSVVKETRGYQEP
jgi:hypothetical protein